MKKQVLRLTESQLHRVIKESVNKILKESSGDRYEATYYLDVDFPDEMKTVECSVSYDYEYGDTRLIDWEVTDDDLSQEDIDYIYYEWLPKNTKYAIGVAENAMYNKTS